MDRRLEKIMDVDFHVDRVSAENLGKISSTVKLRSKTAEPSEVNLTFALVNEDGEEVYTESRSVMVGEQEEKVLSWDYDNLSLDEGEYKAVLKVVKGDVEEGFEDNVQISKKKTILEKINPVDGEKKVVGRILLIIVIIALIGGTVWFIRKRRLKKLSLLASQQEKVQPNNF